jgi:hypothetical protein
MKNALLKFIEENSYPIWFIAISILGTFQKIFKAKELGKNITFEYIISEAIASAFVSISCYFIATELTNISPMVICIICGWLCTFSTIVHHKLEQICIDFFNGIRNFIKLKKAENIEVVDEIIEK